MGRSVSTPRSTLIAAYTDFDGEDQFEWEDFKEELERRILAFAPSFLPREGWAGREDRIIARNSFVNFGVSEYCGCVAIWLQLREDIEDRLTPLAEAWTDKIEDRFLAEFGTMRKIGTASNGETFFRAVA